MVVRWEKVVYTRGGGLEWRLRSTLVKQSKTKFGAPTSPLANVAGTQGVTKERPNCAEEHRQDTEGDDDACALMELR